MSLGLVHANDRVATDSLLGHGHVRRHGAGAVKTALQLALQPPRPFQNPC